MSFEPGILALGPWAVDDVRARWRDDAYEASEHKTAAADDAIAALASRGSPSHDGLAARLAGFSSETGLELELQPLRWGLRLVESDASASIAVNCVVRDGDGRWLAGRRASWVASWAGRWALGAGGSVEVGENPAETLARELHEEWALTPERTQVDALVCLPNRMVMLVGQALVTTPEDLVMDHEHDAYAWWPADPAEWPAEGDGAVRRLATLLVAAGAQR